MRALGDFNRLIGDSLEVAAELHRRDDLTKVRCDRLKTEQNADAIFVDFLFQRINFLFIGESDGAHLRLAIEQAAHGVLQIAIAQACHH